MHSKQLTHASACFLCHSIGERVVEATDAATGRHSVRMSQSVHTAGNTETTRGFLQYLSTYLQIQ
jgi:hypothetical protein